LSPRENAPDFRSAWQMRRPQRFGRNWSAALATRNIDDFADTGVDVVNPWHAGEPQ
jgi:hypothetical protein